MLDPTNIPFGEEYEAEEIFMAVGGEGLLLYYTICRSVPGEWVLVGDVHGWSIDDEPVVLQGCGISTEDVAELIRLALSDRDRVIDHA